MASLKNNSKSKNLHFLSLAFEQAKINLGSTKKIPSVPNKTRSKSELHLLSVS